jgi:hypothetical protein
MRHEEEIVRRDILASCALVIDSSPQVACCGLGEAVDPSACEALVHHARRVVGACPERDPLLLPRLGKDAHQSIDGRRIAHRLGVIECRLAERSIEDSVEHFAFFVEAQVRRGAAQREEALFTSRQCAHVVHGSLGDHLGPTIETCVVETPGRNRERRDHAIHERDTRLRVDERHLRKHRCRGGIGRCTLERGAHHSRDRVHIRTHRPHGARSSADSEWRARSFPPCDTPRCDENPRHHFSRARRHRLFRKLVGAARADHLPTRGATRRRSMRGADRQRVPLRDRDGPQRLLPLRRSRLAMRSPARDRLAQRRARVPERTSEQWQCVHATAATTRHRQLPARLSLSGPRDTRHARLRVRALRRRPSDLGLRAERRRNAGDDSRRMPRAPTGGELVVQSARERTNRLSVRIQPEHDVQLRAELARTARVALRDPRATAVSRANAGAMTSSAEITCVELSTPSDLCAYGEGRPPLR